MRVGFPGGGIIPRRAYDRGPPVGSFGEPEMQGYWRAFGTVVAMLLGLGGANAAADEPVTAIVGATLIRPDREGSDAAGANTTIVIQPRRIQTIGPAGTTPVPAGATRIDGKGKWVIPGLIDTHIHFFQSGN